MLQTDEKLEIPTSLKAQQNSLFLLENLFGLWEQLGPKQSYRQTVFNSQDDSRKEVVVREGIFETIVSPSELQNWYRDSGMAGGQIAGILSSFVQRKLLTSYEFLDCTLSDETEIGTGISVNFNREFYKHYELLKDSLAAAIRKTKQKAVPPSAPDIRPASVGNSDGNELLIFLLSKDGNLARRNPVAGDKLYVLTKDSRRLKVLKVLVSCKTRGYCETADLAETSECSVNDFRRTCEELRTQLVGHFSGIHRSEIIDGKRGSGYRINPKARIIEIP